ncbi:MAG: ABC transporter ATP-binding protein [Eggerthellales bacterium]|nr:ABC transporter ATP-binding protein [Eggerthellales bacterium]
MSLSFENVQLTYDELHALDNLNLQVESGEALAIIGPSGCGKSSMLRLAAGLAQPTSGTVRINGNLAERPRKQTALILQNFGLLPWKTVRQNAELGLLIQGAPAAERTRRTTEALARVGLADFANSYPNQLSGGMQQRLALARAIALDIDTLLMDEPLSALDALLREELQDTLLALWQEKRYTQVLVTHSIEEAVYLGQRIAVMAPRPGRVVATIENPLMGSAQWRSQDAFFSQCRAVRAALEGGSHE